MLNPLMLICLALPLIELVVLVKLGQAIGFWYTVLILLGMAVLGGLLLHRQGWKALQQAQTSMLEGRPPVGPDARRHAAGDRRCAAAGAGARHRRDGLLVADTAGAPDGCPAAAGRARDGADVREDADDGRGAGGGPRRSPGGGPVIEGEFERLDERPASKPREDRRDIQPG